MTAKRFTVPKQYRCIQDNQTEEKYLCEDKSEAIALANLLNALHEENNQLKERNEFLKKQLDRVCSDNERMGDKLKKIGRIL